MGHNKAILLPTRILLLAVGAPWVAAAIGLPEEASALAFVPPFRRRPAVVARSRIAT